MFMIGKITQSLRLFLVFLDNNWNLVSRIQAPISNQQISSSVMKWARENRKMVNTDRDLLVFQMNKLV